MIIESRIVMQSNYQKTAPINLDEFKQYSDQFIEAGNIQERLENANQLINLLKREIWRISGELIEEVRLNQEQS